MTRPATSRPSPSRSNSTARATPAALFGEFRLSGEQRLPAPDGRTRVDRPGVSRDRFGHATADSPPDHRCGTTGVTIVGDLDRWRERRRLRHRVREIAVSACIPPHMTCDVAVQATPSATGARTAQLGDRQRHVPRRAHCRADRHWRQPRSQPSAGPPRDPGPRTAGTWASPWRAPSTGQPPTSIRPTRPTASPVRGSTTTAPTPASTTSAPAAAASSFTTPKRLNPSKQHGSRGSLAASGKFLYATWISTSRWIAYKGTAPRVLYLRRNSNHGSSTAWNTTKRLDVA